MTFPTPADPFTAVGVLLIRSIPLRRDSRSTKMVTAYRDRGYHVTPVTWSRGEAADADEGFVCTVRAGYGDQLKSLSARLKWMAFIALTMIKTRKRYRVIHTVDLDTAIVSVPLALILRKKVVYDAFDSISAILGAGHLATILKKIERFLIARSDVAIFPDPVRLDQYGICKRDNVAIVSNIPDTDIAPVAMDTGHAARPDNHRLRCVYVGTLEAHHRGLEYIAEICRALPDRVEFVIGGTGQIERQLIEESECVENLSYLGRMDYADAIALMTSADLLYAPYLLSAPAHRFASPNKIFEHYMLGKALFTNSGIPPAAMAKQSASGFFFDGTLKSAIATLSAIDKADCMDAGQRARRFWDNHYSNLRARQLDGFFAKAAGFGPNKPTSIAHG